MPAKVENKARQSTTRRNCEDKWNPDDEYLPTSKRTASAAKASSKTGQSRRATTQSQGGQEKNAHGSANASRRCYSKTHFQMSYRRANKTTKTLKEELKKQSEELANAQDRIRNQSNPYFVDDANIKNDCELFTSMVADFAAAWAAEGSLESDLKSELVHVVLDLVRGGTKFCCIANSGRNPTDLVRASGSTRLIAEAILAHFICVQILMRPLLFLQGSINDEKDSSTSIHKALENIATLVQNGGSFAANLWYSRTLQAFYTPTQIKNSFTDPIDDDRYATQRRDYVTGLQDDLLSTDFRHLLKPVTNAQRTNREDELINLLLIGSKLALKLHTQDVLVSTWGCEADHIKTTYKSCDTSMEAHAITNLEVHDTSKYGSPIDVIVHPAIQARQQNPDGSEGRVKTWSKAVIAIIPSGEEEAQRTGEFEVTEADTGDSDYHALFQASKADEDGDTEMEMREISCGCNTQVRRLEGAPLSAISEDDEDIGPIHLITEPRRPPTHNPQSLRDSDTQLVDLTEETSDQPADQQTWPGKDMHTCAHTVAETENQTTYVTKEMSSCSSRSPQPATRNSRRATATMKTRGRPRKEQKPPNQTGRHEAVNQPS